MRQFSLADLEPRPRVRPDAVLGAARRAVLRDPGRKCVWIATRAEGLVRLNDSLLANTWEGEELDVELWPNPIQDRINLRLSSPAELRLHDAQGRLLLASRLQAGRQQVPLPELRAGVYFLQMQSSGKLLTRKLLKLD